jgi:hypothetical protein
MKPYLKTKALLVSLAFCGALQFMATAEAHETSASKGNYLTTDSTLLLAQTRLNRLSESETKDLLNSLEANTRDFQKSIDRALDDSRLDGSKKEDNINGFIKDFKDATKQMRNRYYRERSFSSSDVQEVLNRAARIDNFIGRGRFNNDNIRRDWNNVRDDLDILARSSYGRNSNYNRR